MIDKIKRFFELYPEKDKLYSTPDGNVFLARNDATNHARQSKTNFTEYERGEDGAAADKTGDQDEKNLELIAEGTAMDPATGDYHRMLAILRALKLQPESHKKADVIAAFKNWQAQIKVIQDPATPEATENETQEA